MALPNNPLLGTGSIPVTETAKAFATPAPVVETNAMLQDRIRNPSVWSKTATALSSNQAANVYGQIGAAIGGPNSWQGRLGEAGSQMAVQRASANVAKSLADGTEADKGDLAISDPQRVSQLLAGNDRQDRLKQQGIENTRADKGLLLEGERNQTGKDQLQLEKDKFEQDKKDSIWQVSGSGILEKQDDGTFKYIDPKTDPRLKGYKSPAQMDMDYRTSIAEANSLLQQGMKEETVRATKLNIFTDYMTKTQANDQKWVSGMFKPDAAGEIDKTQKVTMSLPDKSTVIMTWDNQSEVLGRMQDLRRTQAWAEIMGDSTAAPVPAPSPSPVPAPAPTPFDPLAE